MLKMGVGDTVIGKKNGKQNEDRSMSVGQLSLVIPVKSKSGENNFFMVWNSYLFMCIFYMFISCDLS